jgi:ABC-type Mn2+/Zn2+ transport system permease subunit
MSEGPSQNEPAAFACHYASWDPLRCNIGGNALVLHEFAASLGLSLNVLATALLLIVLVLMALNVIVALVVVGGMTSIGLLLISAMMVVPVAAATQVARSYRKTMLLGSLIGAASAVIGLLVAFYADTTPGALAAKWARSFSSNRPERMR